MVDFIETDDEEVSSFEKYFVSDIVPAVEEVNRVKDKYRTKFWGYFWTILFLMCINLLISFFGFLLNNHPLNYEQLFLVNTIALIVMFYPIYQYAKAPKLDVFGIFLDFYGNWRHEKNKEVSLVHSPIIPPHDYVYARHNIAAEYPDWCLELRDTVYGKNGTIRDINYKRKVSSGVVLLVKYKQKFKGKILLFDKKGFYRKNKFEGLSNVGNVIAPTIAECFHIFSDNADFAEDMLPTLFFDGVLELKNTLGAKRLYVEIQGDIMRLYFEGAQLYIDSDKFWSNKINRNKFIQLNSAIEQTLLLIETVTTLREQHDRH